jgi:hypothetical protein
MSPGCTYRSGECDENASWQGGAGGEDSFKDSTPRPPRREASLRARVTTVAPPCRPSSLHHDHRDTHACRSTTILPGPAPRHGARLLLPDAGALVTEDAHGLVALDPAVVVDLDEAMALVRALATQPGHPETVPADVASATALLAADVLPGWTDAWLAVERERFRQIRLNALEELSAALTAAGRFGDAVATAREAVRTAPSRETARRALIEAHLAQGEITEAVAEYDEYQELLRSSVGALPTFGLDGLLPPVPAWPVLRTRRPAERVPVAAPGLRVARGPRRLVSGGAVR